MKTIIINSKKHGIKKILVDDEDFEALNKFKWGIKKSHNTYYAFRNIPFGTQLKTVGMHSVILNTNKLIDHKDHNGLNNQKHNIRVCSKTQNGQNRTSAKNSSSKYLGVALKKVKSLKPCGSLVVYCYWQSMIMINKKHTFIGTFKNEIDAALSYNEAAKKHHGEFANLNIIEAESN